MGRPKENAPKGYATVSEAAAFFGVTEQAIYNRIKAGTIPFERSLKQNGQWSYYLPREWVEQEMEERASRDQPSLQVPAGLQAEFDGISERLNKLSEGQEELQKAVREILAAPRNEAPTKRPDGQKPSENSNGHEERSALAAAYQRADDPEFLELVGRDVRGNGTPEEHALLRAPQNAQLWRDGLKAILSDLQTQFAERKATAEKFRTECFRKGESGKKEWFDYKAELDAWRGGALRFKRSVEMQLAEAKRLTQEHQQQDDKERFRQLLVETLDFLNEDEAITYKYTPNRDTLREKISGALYKSR